MKKFFVILQYEMETYFKNTAFLVSTLVISLIAAVIIFIPSIFDVSDLLGIEADKEDKHEYTQEEMDKWDTILICDKNNYFKNDYSLLEGFFAKKKFESVSSKDELEKKVREKDVSAGFVINSLTSYDYYIFNNSMYSDDTILFNQALTILNQIKYCEDNNLDYTEIATNFNPVIDSEINILGKDMMDNYWYCYILVIVVFMMIIMYGIMVATSVTQEKSNRTIEVLVTSADTNSLFFAKVIAGTLSALCQAGVIFVVVLGSYGINQKSWGGKLDILLDIPAEVLFAFAFFGLGGLLFYSFIYGAMGALVSKTEDINKSAGGVQFVIMIVYFAVLLQLNNIDGVVIKVLSYLPISSYSAMFARIAMGTVATWEIVIAYIILVASTILVGILGSKIYRMGTLRYGNPIKLTNALKSLKRE